MRALIITDVQNDFLPGGALPVKEGDKIVWIINRLIPHFEHVIATQDWHPFNHISFGNPWPIHCVENTWGADFSPHLNREKIEAIFHKGIDANIDSYSVFFDAKERPSTKLHEYLQKKRVKDLYFVGLATDFCVLYSVLDALKLGYHAYVIQDACRGIDDSDKALEQMKQRGANIIDSKKLLL